MTTSSPLFDINELTTEQQEKFHIVYNEVKSKRDSYIQYKIDLQLKAEFNREEEENEWHYELYRFLRARKWNISHTIKSILEMIQWRIDNHIDSVLEDQSVIQRIEIIRQILPNVNHGYTKVGRPLYIEKTGLMHVDKLLNRFQPDELIRCHIYWLELNSQLARERSRQLGKHVESFAMVHDLNGCKLEIRKILNVFKQSLFIDDNYYPERLGQMFMINPPMIFPTLWNLVKYWLDPVTKSKIQVIKKGPETSTILLQHIDSDQLPQEYGGSCHSCSTSPDCIPIYDWNNDTTIEKRDGK